MSGRPDEDRAELTPIDPDPPTDFLIVGLGGSAGAIGALQAFFRAVPEQSRIAWVVVVHLSPEHESRLAEVLQTCSAIPVAQVTSAVRVKPDHIYVIPPNRSLSMNDGTLQISDVVSTEERRAPIDIFFRTLAHEHGARAASVILSGTGSDGSMGIKRIKEYNGLVLAQDPGEAEFDEMPRNSIATGLVDQVLPVAAMPAKIVAYRDRSESINLSRQDRAAGNDEKALVEIFTILRNRTGHDFGSYKRGTVLRRLERRMSVHEIAALPEYARYLRANVEESQALLNDLLISVTNFFRDPAAFDAFAEKVVPRLFERKTADDQIRIWVPACASGEEAYSIAMLLAEAASNIAFRPSIQIFATDLDEKAIARAREGCYTAAEMADVSPERIRRFFMKDHHEQYRVRRELREMILFARHNATKDPPFSHLAVVSCRNLFIYLNRSAQERLMEVIHFALDPGGLLFLGSSESIESATHLFSVLDKEAHLYQRRPGPAGMPRGRIATDLGSFERPVTFAPVLRAEPLPRERITPLDLHQRLLELYAPPSLIVDDEFDIVHLSERAGSYLEFTGGDASLNLLRVVRPEIRLDVRAALQQAAQSGTSVEASGLAVGSGEARETISLLVQPVSSEADGGRSLFLVLFRRDHDGPESAQTPSGDTIVAAGGPVPHLEEELVRVKTQMRATVEQYETHAEELRAANEELQAINEELRSASEELETSKEELQSVNEELHTVNQELKIKIEELSHTNDDMRNLMSSTGIATIFVDRAVRVKLFTPRIADIFNLLPTDAGRPLADITNKLSDRDTLVPEIESVLEHLHTIEREIATTDGRWHLVRLLPYRTAEDRIDGVVLTFLDITTRRRAEEELRISREELEKHFAERTADLQRSKTLLGAAVEERATLLRQLVDAQEEERRRIARELHDELGQHLIALKVGMESAIVRTNDPKLERLRSILADVDKSLQRLALQLRPPGLEEAGLDAAIASLTEAFRVASGIAVDLAHRGDQAVPLAPEVQTTLYRVLQESLNNAWKHASAGRVSIVVEQKPEYVKMIIEDDGLGFGPLAPDAPVAPTRLGLLGIRERLALVGGDLTIESVPGSGTSLYVRIPLPPAE